MRDVVRQLVLQSQFFFLEAVEKVFVGMSAMLFFFDQGMERRCFDSISSTAAFSMDAIPFADAIDDGANKPQMGGLS